MALVTNKLVVGIIPVFKDSQANFKAALATFVIGCLDRKFG